MHFLRLIAVLALMAFCGTWSPAAEPLEFEATGSVTLKMEERQTVFVITSERGIGSSTMRLKAGQWPRDVVLRLQYKEGSGFNMLESFAITTERFQISWQPSRDKKEQLKWGEQQMGFQMADAEGKFPKDVSSAGYFTGRVDQTKRGIEVRLPANLFAGSKEVKIGWVDAFRN